MSKKKTEASWLPVLGLGLTLALNFGQMAYTGGVVMTRLSAVEETAKQSQLKYDSVNGSNVKMASLEANLTNVIEQLKRIEGRLDRVLSEAPSNVRK